jgi:hypothetical protein
MKTKMFIIFNVEELPIVDFSNIWEQSQYTVRVSLDGTKTFIKWDTADPPWFLDNIQSKEGPYNPEEMSNILLTPEWNHPYPKPVGE